MARLRRLAAGAGALLAMATTAVAVAAPAASAGTTPPAFDPMFTPNGTAKCDSTTGQWSVVWNVFTRSLVPSVVTAATDPATGAPVTIGASRVLPAGATSTAVTVVAHRTGGTESVTYQRTLSMGDCVQATLGSPCVGREGGRYVHTLDGPTGTATIRLTSNRTCESQFFHLWSGPNPAFTLAYQVGEAIIGGTTNKVATQVALPTCSASLALLFGPPFPSVHPSSADSVLGAAAAPGNQSSGPLARYSGATPCALPNLDVRARCTGWFDVAAENPGPSPVEVHFEDGTPPHFLTEGERFDLSLPTPGYYMGQQLHVMANGILVHTAQWSRPAACPRVHGDVNDSGRGDATLLFNWQNNAALFVDVDNGGGFRYLANAWAGLSAFPMSRVKGVAADYNGDDFTDAAFFRSEQTGRVTLHRLVSTLDSFANHRYNPVVQAWDSAGAGSWALDRMRPLAGDFNADDREDVAVLYDFGGCVSGLLLFFGTPTGFTPPAQLWTGSWCAASSYPFTGDFDADGDTDIAAYYNYGGGHTAIWNWMSTPTGFRTGIKSLDRTGYDVSTSKIVTGDFNGDSRTDIAHLTPYPNQEWRIFGLYSAGETFGAPTEWYHHPQWSADPARIVLNAADYNADGRADLGFYYRHANQQVGKWYADGTATGIGPFSAQELYGPDVSTLIAAI